MSLKSGEVLFEMGDTTHIALRRYNDGQVTELGESVLNCLDAVTKPGTPFRIEESTHVEIVDGEWVDYPSFNIIGPDDASSWKYI